MLGNRDIFIAGGTSDVGNRVVNALVNMIGPKRITCLYRNSSDISFLISLKVNLVKGDVTFPETFMSYLNEDSIYIDMTHPKYYHKSIDAVSSAGVKRAIFITTTGIFSKYNYCSDIYKLGESRIKSSGIAYTILRPSMIYGTERDRNMTKLLKYMSKYPAFPVFGNGQCLMQPVYVQDLADGIVTAIIKEAATRFKEYNFCGPFPFPYIELLKIASRVLNKRVKFIHIPYWFAVGSVAIAELIPSFPIKKEQVLRLLEDKSFDISTSKVELGFSPRSFDAGIKEEIEHLRKQGLL